NPLPCPSPWSQGEGLPFSVRYPVARSRFAGNGSSAALPRVKVTRPWLTADPPRPLRAVSPRSTSASGGWRLTASTCRRARPIAARRNRSCTSRRRLPAIDIRGRYRVARPPKNGNPSPWDQGEGLGVRVRALSSLQRDRLADARRLVQRDEHRGVVA